MPNYHIPPEQGNTYHLFNHAVGSENLFRNKDNYHYFLKRYGDLVSTICDTYAYILLPNHFHLVVTIKPGEQLYNEYSRAKQKILDLTNPALLSDFIMERFSNWLNSYAKAYNKMYNRKGALFIDYLKRSKIESQQHFQQVVHYIHHNATHHGFCNRMEDWLYSSYHAYILQAKSKIKKVEGLELYGGEENFIRIHQGKVKPLDEYEFL